jgi:hypothetical protein
LIHKIDPRLHRFHRLAQTVKTQDVDKASKVTRKGNKLIIEQTHHNAGSALELGKRKK